MSRLNGQIRRVKAVDLFAGAGGTSTGLRDACRALGYELQLLAINHWDIAIATHSTNHPEARHICSTIESVDPRQAVSSGHLDLLVASPECTHHSRARGGKPISDQSRASAWRIVEWASTLTIDSLLIENVPEFQSWGPIGVNGKPLKSRCGETYQAFLNALRSLGYKVDSRILNAANYGDPTTRERLFIQARRGRRPIIWPEITHSRDGRETLFGASPRWRSAREIIDWSIPGESIFKRKRPLAPNTLARIAAGLKRFGGLDFIVPQLSGGRVRSVEEPLPTITTTSTGVGFCQPFLVVLRNHAGARSIEKPLPALTANGTHFGLCEPFLVPFFGERNGQAPRVHSIDEPLATVTGQGAGAVVEPFIIPLNHGKGDHRSHSLNEPMRTITSVDAWALIEPFLMRYQGNHAGRQDGNSRVHSVEQPLPVVDTSNRYALIEPFLVKYNGTGGAMSVDDPLDTVTAKDRFALVESGELGAVLDIRFRMLQPHELAAAMSFPNDYKFTGNREQRVKQIGNAVPVKTAQALCEAVLAA